MLMVIDFILFLKKMTWLPENKTIRAAYMRKPFFCICENKDADQLRGSLEADQRFCFCHTDSSKVHNFKTLII